MVSSHDIGELETLADRVGFLDSGRLLLSDSMEAVRDRIKHVDLVMRNGTEAPSADLPHEWMTVKRAGARLSFLLPDAPAVEREGGLGRWFPDPARIEIRPASLREVFVGLATREQSTHGEAAQ